MRDQWNRLIRDIIKILSIYLKNANWGFNLTIHIFQTLLEDENCFEDVKKFIYDHMNKSYEAHSRYLKQMGDYKKCKGGSIEDVVEITNQLKLIFDEEAKV